MATCGGSLSDPGDFCFHMAILIDEHPGMITVVSETVEVISLRLLRMRSENNTLLSGIGFIVLHLG